MATIFCSFQKKGKILKGQIDVDPYNNAAISISLKPIWHYFVAIKGVVE